MGILVMERTGGLSMGDSRDGETSDGKGTIALHHDLKQASCKPDEGTSQTSQAGALV
jgi:hypothetical protein